jgi:hypothetical protein
MRTLLTLFLALTCFGFTFDGLDDGSGLPASRIETNTDEFDKNLSILDTNVQKALETLDELTAGGGGTPGGSNTQVQYNNAGSFAGSSAFTFDAVDGALYATKFYGDGTNITGLSGSGTVTNLTVNGSDGIAVSSATTTSTPVIGLSLTDLTPDSVEIGGVVPGIAYANDISDNQSSAQANHILTHNNTTSGFGGWTISNGAAWNSFFGRIVLFGADYASDPYMSADSVNNAGMLMIHSQGATGGLAIGNPDNYPVRLFQNDREALRIDADGFTFMQAGNYLGDLSTDGLYIDGGVNATTYYGDGSNLSNLPSGSSQWDDVTGGIKYSAGNVGIGTISPAFSLDVVGGAVKFTSDSGESLRVSQLNSSGISIVATAPSLYADLANGDSALAGQFSYAGAGNAYFGNSAYAGYFNFNGANVATFGTPTASGVFQGNVGIGSSSPTKKLQVVGDATISGSLTVDGAIYGNGANLTNLPTGVTDHAALSSLTYATAGHTGFAPDASPTFTGTISGANVTLSGSMTVTGDVTVADEAYGSGWNGVTEVPTKNAVYDKIETLSSSGLSHQQVMGRIWMQ